MANSIFLSASVPDPRRAPEYAASSDSVAIAAAVSALLHVCLGRRSLVWGGHPAITPMVCVVAESMGVDYGSWVKLYQSEHFLDEYPEDNARFQNVTYVEEVGGDREKSLRRMRERMFAEQDFCAGVFIGGMGGVIDEFELLLDNHPSATMLPVPSTGGAALELAARLAPHDPGLADERDYVALFHAHLGISPRENRYWLPSDQPVEPENRLWTRSRTPR